MIVPPNWRILWNVGAISFAFMLFFTAWYGMSNLQSSINSSEELGTTSLLTVYATYVFSNMFATVGIIKWLSIKWAMVVATLTAVPYYLAQMMPSFYTLIPTALLLGLAAGPLLSGVNIYLSIIAEAYSRLTSVPKPVVITRFFGVYFTLISFSQIWGNLVSALVFLSDQGAGNSDFDFEDACGPKFAAGAGLSYNSTEKRPSNENINIVGGAYVCCTLIATIIMAVGLDSLKRYNDESRKDMDTESSNLKVLMATVRLMKEQKQLFLIPILLWVGMMAAFLVADFTQAYVNCAWGVKKVSLVMICYGVTNAASALSTSSVAKLVGRVPLVTVAAALYASLLLALHFWIPSMHTSYVAFVVSGLWGACDGVFSVHINALSGLAFPGREEAAYTNYRLWEALGLVLAYGCSPVLSIHVKLYILLALLMAGIAGYYVVEWYMHTGNENNAYNINLEL